MSELETDQRFESVELEVDYQLFSDIARTFGPERAGPLARALSHNTDISRLYHEHLRPDTK